MINAQRLGSVSGAISGLFRLSEIKKCTRSDGRPFRILKLDDASGSVTGVVWPSTLPLLDPVTAPSYVSVHGICRRFNNAPQIEINWIQTVPVEQIKTGASLLPRQLCPAIAHRAFDHLWDFHDHLEPLPLRQFLTRVLLDPAIGIPFIQCKGSQHHHHAYPGGLLVHSIDTLNVVGEAIRSALPDERWSPAITQVGYLLHDLGKIRTVGTGIRPAEGKVLRHEPLTTQLLSPHLSWLQYEWPEGALGLQYIFDYCSRPAAARGFAKFVGAEVVAWADQLSVAKTRDRSLKAISRHLPPALEPQLTDECGSE